MILICVIPRLIFSTGEAAYAALCGLQKVVRGFNEQECVSPFTAVRSAPHHGGLRESLTKRSFTQEEEGDDHHWGYEDGLCLDGEGCTWVPIFSPGSMIGVSTCSGGGV